MEGQLAWFLLGLPAWPCPSQHCYTTFYVLIFDYKWRVGVSIGLVLKISPRNVSIISVRKVFFNFSSKCLLYLMIFLKVKIKKNGIGTFLTHHLVIIYNQILPSTEEVWQCEGQGQGRDKKKKLHRPLSYL